MPDYLKFVSTCSRNVVPVLDQPQMVYLLIEIFPGSDISVANYPLNFALVLDRSGSMGGEKLRTLKEAVKNILNRLRDDDIITLITFESRSEILAAAEPAAKRADLKRLVDQMRDGGGTNIAPALNAALKLVSQHARGERISRIILLTDGEATDTETDSYQIADLAGAQGIPLIGLGFGQDWNESFLIELADRSMQAAPGSRAGLVDYIPHPEQANSIFQEVYRSMQVAAQQVYVTLRLVQGVETRRVWQVRPLIRELNAEVIQGRSIQIPVGQLEMTGVAYLCELLLPSRPEGIVRIAQADVAFTLPDQGQKRQAADLILNYSNKPDLPEQTNELVMAVVEKVQAFRLQTQALEDAQAGDVSRATRKLRQAVTILLSQGEEELAQQMEKEVDALERSGAVSNEGKKTILLTSRKTVRFSDPESSK